jgi:hypothetical protein
MDEKQIQVVRGYFSASEVGYCVASPSDSGVSQEVKTNDKPKAFDVLERAPNGSRLFHFDGKLLWMLVAGK